jgi:hypothetical protein
VPPQYRTYHRHSDPLKLQVIREAVFEACSHTEVARRYGIHPRTVARWITLFAEQLPAHTDFNTANELDWSGIMVIDGKELSLPGGSQCCYIAVDAASGDLIHWTLEDAENQRTFSFFLAAIRDHVNYPVWAVTSDLGRARCFLGPVSTLLPHVQHQACIVHFFGRFFPYLGIATHKGRDQHRMLRHLLSRTLMAASLLEATQWRDYLVCQRHLFTTRIQMSAIASLLRNFDRYTIHFADPSIPRDTNMAENIFSRLQQSIAASRGLPHRVATYNILKVWFWFYRTTPLINSSVETRVHRSPLQLNGFKHQPGWVPQTK